MKLQRKRRKRTPKQQSFLTKLGDVFIGSKRGTHAKTHRPLDSRKPLHVCFRSKFAKGKRTMLGINKVKVNSLVDEISKRFGIKVLKFANVGNHLHMVIKIPGSTMTSRRQYAKWIRLLTSRLAYQLGGSKKGRPFRDENGNRVKFWDAIPFSRVIHGRRGWNIISRYVLKNEFESQGASPTAAVAMANELFESAQALDLPDWKNSA